MLIFGAVDFAAALSRMAKLLGFRVTVCDAREMFSTRTRFPDADEVVVDWPHRYLELDVPALTAALATRAGFIGAMGSRRTRDARVQRLRTAVSICAEIIAARSGKRAAHSLSDLNGPIHTR